MRDTPDVTLHRLETVSEVVIVPIPGYGTEAIRKRRDGGSVETDRAVDPAAKVGRSPARTQHARGVQCDAVYRTHGMFVAAIATRISPVGNGVPLFPVLPAGWNVGEGS